MSVDSRTMRNLTSGFPMDDFPLGGALVEALPPNYIRVIDIIVRTSLIVRVDGDVYIYVDGVAQWTPLKSRQGSRHLCDTLGMDNVTVNYSTAVEPYYEMAERLAPPLDPIDHTTVCIGTRRFNVQLGRLTQKYAYRYEMVVKRIVLDVFVNRGENLSRAEEEVFKNMCTVLFNDEVGETQSDRLYEVHPAEVEYSCCTDFLPKPEIPWVDPRQGGFALTPIISRHFPPRMLAAYSNPIEDVIANSMDAISLKVLMWCLGNAIVTPVNRPRIVYLFGSGGNGKSTLINLILHVFQGCSKPLSNDYVGNNKPITTEDKLIMMLNRIVTIGDVKLDKDGGVNSEFWKRVTGGDFITADGMTARINSTLIMGGNSIWYPSYDMMRPWFSRRTIALPMKSVMIGALRPQDVYDDVDRLRFLNNCIAIRLMLPNPPVTLRMAITTIFGVRSRVATRGIQFESDPTPMESLVATFSMCIATRLGIEDLCELFRSINPDLVGEYCGSPIVLGIGPTTSLYKPQ